MSVRKTTVTMFAAAAISLLAWVPAQAVPHGETSVAQNQPRYQQQRAVITGIDLANGTTTFYRGNTINVVLNGTPRGTATFDIVGLQSGIAMREVSRGHYTGSLLVQRRMQITDARLVGHLRLNNGQRAKLMANGGLTIVNSSGSQNHNNTGYQNGTYNQNHQNGNNQNGTFNQEMFVNVASPQSGQTVGRDFSVTGNSVPNAQIVVTAGKQGGLFNNQAATIRGTADANGNFAIPIRVGSNDVLSQVLGNGGFSTLTVVATDPRTSQSRQVQMNIATGH